MRRNRASIALTLTALMFAPWAHATSLIPSVMVAGSTTTSAPTGSTAPGTDVYAGDEAADTVVLPCTAVAAYWTGNPPSGGMPPGPGLAVVSIDVRPKSTQVHLDDQFVGRAKYLDGKPGYLYLEPGAYTLELRHEDYRTVVVKLQTAASCRYDLKHRMERARGQSTASVPDTYGKGKPFQRVYAPKEALESRESARVSGPDVTLRRDLSSNRPEPSKAAGPPTASIRLRVSPDSASVSIDGVFVATGRELARMEKPLATTAGEHHIVVRAPGFVEVEKSFEVGEDDVVEIEISLSEIITD